MSEQHPSPDDHHAPVLYEIRIKGHLDTRWADWFEGLTLSLEKNGDTVLIGPDIDQAALPRLLRIMCDLGMTLRSVNLRKEDFHE